MMHMRGTLLGATALRGRQIIRRAASAVDEPTLADVSFWGEDPAEPGFTNLLVDAAYTVPDGHQLRVRKSPVPINIEVDMPGADDTVLFVEPGVTWQGPVAENPGDTIYGYLYLIRTSDEAMITALELPSFVIAETFEASGVTDSSTTESDTTLAIDIFDTDDGDGGTDIGLITGGQSPYSAVKDSGDAALTISGDGQQIVVDRTTPGTYSITLTGTDNLDQSVQITHGVTVNDALAVTTDGDTATIEASGTFTETIPEGEPYAGTYTIDPTLYEAVPPYLWGQGAEQDNARPYYDGQAYLGKFGSDADANPALSLVLAWYRSDESLIDSETYDTANTDLIGPDDAGFFEVTPSDGYGQGSSHRAYILDALTVDSPQSWGSNATVDPDTYDAAQHFTGGSGSITYSIASDATGQCTINASTGVLTITGGAVSGAVVVRATDSMTPTPQTADLTVNVTRTADNTAPTANDVTLRYVVNPAAVGGEPSASDITLRFIVPNLPPSASDITLRYVVAPA